MGFSAEVGGGAPFDDLRATTVALSHGDRQGTGFFVGQDLLLTCGHVIGNPLDGAVVEGVWNGRSLRFSPVESSWREVEDLIVLRRADADDKLIHPWVCWSDELAPGDRLGACGYPVGEYRSGDSVGLVYDGPSERTDGALLLRATQGRASPGFSGSPVMNWRTGGVCGMLRRADAPPGGPPGVRITPARVILKAYPDLVDTRLTGTSLDQTWLLRLDDAQMRAGRWRYPGPRLRAYLAAVHDGATEHPYAFAQRGGPSLNTVYLRQQFRASAAPAAPGPSDRAARPDQPRIVTAEDAMAANRDGFVILGDPGAGKSSLLRDLTERSARNWLEGDVSAGFVPVLVSAQSLVGAQVLGSALEDGTVSAVGPRLNDPRLAELFQEEPIPGVPWLVLIDGVDEVLDPEARRRLLKTVRFWRENGKAFRFVLASRPLPADDMRELRASKAAVYEIQPFTVTQLPEFAERWFAALHVADPAGTARRFERQLTTSRLLPLAQLPLIATMICVVFAEDADRELPHSRVELYGRFVDILMDKSTTQVKVLQRLQHRLMDYGAAAQHAVDRLLSKLRPLLIDLAISRQQGSTATLLDLAAQRSRKYVPANVSAEKWLDILREALTQTGLITQRGDELEFMHYTVQEFLAAHGATDGRRPTERDAHRLIGEVAARSQSYALFVAGLWIARYPSWSRAVADVALADAALAGGHAWGAEFFAELVREGVQLEHGLADEALHRMVTIVEDDRQDRSTRVRAFDALGILDRDAALRVLRRSSAARSSLNLILLEFAAALTRESGRETASLLEALAVDPTVHMRLRLWALDQHTRRFHDARASLLTRLLTSPVVGAEMQRDAGTRLIREVKADHTAVLRSVATNEVNEPALRMWAALRIQRTDPGLGGGLIAAVAVEQSLSHTDRLEAIHHLVVSDRERAVATLSASEVVTAAGRSTRLEGVLDLAYLDPVRAAPLLRDAVDDRGLAPVERVKAATTLRDFDPEAATATLVEIAATPGLDPVARFAAADELFWAGAPARCAGLSALAADAALRDADRARAAEELAGVDLAAAEEPLRRIARNSTDTAARMRCLLALAAHGSGSAVEDGTAFVSDPAVGWQPKYEYARGLIAHLPAFGVDIIAGWLRDPVLDAGDRLVLARALARRQPAEVRRSAVPLLDALARDPSLRSAAEAAARQARRRQLDLGLRARPQVTGERPRLPYRYEAALLLVDVDAPAGAALMRTLAAGDDDVADHALAWLAGERVASAASAEHRTWEPPYATGTSGTRPTIVVPDFPEGLLPGELGDPR